MLLFLLACSGDQPETGGPPLDDLILLSESGRSRIHFFDRATGEDRGSYCLQHVDRDRCRPLSDGDARCLPFSVRYEADADRLLFAWTWFDDELEDSPGGLGYVRPATGSEPDWHFEDLAWDVYQPEFNNGLCVDATEWTPTCNLRFTHTVERDPADEQRLIVADTLNSRFLWVEPSEAVDTDGDGIAQVVAVLDERHPAWDDFLMANHAEAWIEDSTHYLLTTFKSGDHPEIAPRNAGRVVLWDVTDLQEIRRVWAWPEEGHLAAVHHARRVERQGESWLLYAHSLGADDSWHEGEHGSLGVARWMGEEPPVYVGDGILPGGAENMGFLREAEYDAERDLIMLVDSGCENPDIETCTRLGRLIEVYFPEWDDSGLSGAFSAEHEEQAFHELEVDKYGWVDGLDYPYEVELLSVESLGESFTAGEVSACAGVEW